MSGPRASLKAITTRAIMLVAKQPTLCPQAHVKPRVALCRFQAAKALTNHHRWQEDTPWEQQPRTTRTSFNSKTTLISSSRHLLHPRQTRGQTIACPLRSLRLRDCPPCLIWELLLSASTVRTPTRELCFHRMEEKVTLPPFSPTLVPLHWRNDSS